MQDFQDEFEDDNVKVLMIDVDNGENAALVIAWMNQNGVTTVTTLLQGSSVYNWFGDGYIPYNVFLDPDFIVRYTDSGYSQGAYDTWVDLVEQYAINYDYPFIEDLSWTLTDDGNDDDHPDAGETCTMTFTVANHDGCATAEGVSAELFSADPAIDITNAYCTFPDIPGGESAISTTVEFAVDAALEPHIADFTFTVDSENGFGPQTFDFSLILGRASWLVVDDDDGQNHAEWIVTSLDELGMYVDVWDGSVAPVSAETLNNYEIVFWATGTAESTLDVDEQAAAEGYLDNGGNLLISSQYLGEELGGTDFFSNYLHAEHHIDNVQYSWVDGVDGAPIADGLSFLLAGAGDGAANSVSPSACYAVAPAEEFLKYANEDDEYAGTVYNSGSYKVIYMGFPIEAIGGMAGTDSRNDLLEPMIEWFNAESVAERMPFTAPEQFVMARAYPNPFNPVTTVEINLTTDAAVDLSFYDLLGAEVQSLTMPQLTAGIHQVEFNGADLASGVYFVRVDAMRLHDGLNQVEQLKLNLVK